MSGLPCSTKIELTRVKTSFVNFLYMFLPKSIFAYRVGIPLRKRKSSFLFARDFRDSTLFFRNFFRRG